MSQQPTNEYQRALHYLAQCADDYVRQLPASACGPVQREVVRAVEILRDAERAHADQVHTLAAEAQAMREERDEAEKRRALFEQDRNDFREERNALREERDEAREHAQGLEEMTTRMHHAADEAEQRMRDLRDAVQRWRSDYIANENSTTLGDLAEIVEPESGDSDTRSEMESIADDTPASVHG